MIADHYSPYSSLISGRQDALKKVAVLQKTLPFFIFWHFAVVGAYHKELRRRIPCQFRRTVYWHCENGINVGIVLLATTVCLLRKRGQFSKFAMCRQAALSISGSLTAS